MVVGVDFGECAREVCNGNESILERMLGWTQTVTASLGHPEAGLVQLG